MSRPKGSKNKEEKEEKYEYIEVLSSNSDLKELGIKQLVRIKK